MLRALRFLAARWLAAYLLLSYAAFCLLLLIWGARAQAAVVQSISRLIPFVAAYALATINLAACMALYLPVVRRRVSLALPADVAAAPLGFAPGADLAARARRARLRLRWLRPGAVAVLHRHRLSPLGTVIFHLALLLLPVAYLVSGATRFEGAAWILEGHAFGGTRAEYYRVDPADAFEARAPRMRFAVEAVEARFWGDRLFFTELRALTVSGEGQRRDPRWTTLPQPLRMDGARVSLRGFHYSPSYALEGPGGAQLRSGDLQLQLFPAGKLDGFSLPGLPHRVWLRLYPDAAAAPAAAGGGGWDGGGQALARPLLHVAVTRGKKIVAHGWRRPGQWLAFDGLRISFPAIRRGGEIVVHRDWGYPVLWLALALALLGGAWRTLLPATRVWLVREGETWLAVVRADAFAGERGEETLAQLGEGR